MVNTTTTDSTTPSILYDSETDHNNKECHVITLIFIYRIKVSATITESIIIAGPTAKSDVAAHICDQMNGTIVSADSVQVYKKVQIGANKPSAEELQRTPHILVNLMNHITPNCNTAEWRRDAIHTIRQLTGIVGVDGASGNESMNMMAEADGLSEQTMLEDQE